MTDRYDPQHHRQYDFSARTATSGCTWTSAAMGADASTGGDIDPSPDQVLSKVSRTEETNPATPGWSMGDVDKAMGRIGVAFADRTGGTWADVVAALDKGHYIILQGDSDQFGDATCSGRFDGDHAVGVHPDRDDYGRQGTNDPICPARRFETRAALRAYAEKLARRIGEYPGLRFGVFLNPVPLAVPDTSTEDAMYSIAGVDGPFPATLKANTPIYDGPTGPAVRQTFNNPSQPFTVACGNADGTRWAIYGRTTDRTKLGWVAKDRVVR